MIKHLVFVFAILVTMSASAQVSDPATHPSTTKYFSDSTNCSITVERDSLEGFESSKITTVTPSFHVQQLWHEGNVVSVMISEISKQVYISSAEGEEGHISLSARVDGAGGSFNKTIWRKTLDANSINYSFDFCEATYAGCCASESTRELIRYSDGSRLLMLTSPLLRISIPNTRLQRYIGYLGDNAAVDYSDIHDSLLCMVLTYVDPESLNTQRLVVSFKDRQIADTIGFGMVDKITLLPTREIDKKNYQGAEELQLWSRDGIANPSGFSDMRIILHFYGKSAPELAIPVVNDRLDVSKIRSKWFTFSLK